MKTNRMFLPAVAAALMTAAACEKVDVPASGEEQSANELVSLQDVALLLSSVNLGTDRITEVYDAVSSSCANGYDEEYMLSDLLDTPGAGVGEEKLKSGLRCGAASPREYERPMRDIFSVWCDSLAGGSVKSSLVRGVRTAAGSSPSAEDYMEYIRNSDMQIYWPQCEDWDGSQTPVITFAPEDDSAESNVGWCMDAQGRVEQLVVDEEMTLRRPVWVINRNDDSHFTSLDVMKKNNPSWMEGGLIKLSSSSCRNSPETKAAASGSMLVLKSFKMLRHYDSWLRGASEFFVKMGAIDSFTASTEAELKLYDPQITDFMVVVRRKELGTVKDLGAILVSDWTEQLEDSAFMVIEDDGGSQTSWKCSGTVKVASKSYGFDVTLPLRSYDDVVWRGKLSRKYLDSAESVTGRFGDTEITFAIEEY